MHTDTKRPSRGLLLGILMVLTTAGAALATATKVTIRFNPPDKTTCTETVKKATTTEMAGKRLTMVREIVTRRAFHKTAAGFEMVETPVSSKATENGKALPMKGGDALNGKPLTYVFDKAGKLQTIRGLGFLAKLINADLAKQKGGKQAKKVTEADLRNDAIATWKAQTGAMVGASVTVGETRITVDPISLPRRTDRPGHLRRPSGHDEAECVWASLPSDSY